VGCASSCVPRPFTPLPPIPPDVQAAITDPNMYTRCGAVSELRSRLASEELPVAAGAYEALAELARTDIRFVADQAAAALSQAAVRPEETELHFGERRQGSAPPHHMVKLLGPPIARACSPRASDDWIRVNEATDGFDIWVDTTRTGALRGSLDLKGPTGEAIIAVDVELLPQAAQTSAARRLRKPPDQAMMAAAISTGQPEGRSAAMGRRIKRKAAEQGGQDIAEVAQPQAAAPQATTSAAPPAARPRIRMGLALAGTVIALLAAIAGLISQILVHGPLQSGINFFANLAFFAVLLVVAVIALMEINRLVIIGFIQGMWWLAAAFLAASIVILAHISRITGRNLAADLLSFTGYALGVIAAILLMVSWSRVADRRRVPRIHALPVMLLSTVGFSQVAALIFYVTAGLEVGSYYSYYSLDYYIHGSAGLLVGLAVTWYAMSLRTRSLGGALVLGWVTVAVLELMKNMTMWSVLTGVERFCSVLECVLLAAVVVLTIFYVRGPSDLDGSANYRD
jgi:hypothetical protein